MRFWVNRGQRLRSGLQQLSSRWLILAAVVAGLGLPAFAQERPSTPLVPVVNGAASLGSAASLDQILHEGLNLERQRKWDEALTKYEQVRKEHPQDRRLEERFQFARMHYDVARRYSDATFRTLASDQTIQQALGLYDEVLLKIESHYVEQPNWKQLLDRGTAALDIAFTDEGFLKRNVAGVSDAQFQAAKAEILRTMQPARADSRLEAKQAVHWAAHYARRELGIPPAAIVLEYLCGAANSLDDYSAFLSSSELKEVYGQIQGNFVGLGIELKGVKDKGLLVLRVINKSPAEGAGIRSKDMILAVDGKTTALESSTEKAADMLQGEENTSVRVTIQSPGQAPRDVTVTRRRVEVPSVEEVKMLDASAGIAYFRMTSFQESTDGEVNAALWSLHRQGMKSLIVDLRGNPGGLLRSAVDVVDRFVSRGTIVSTRGRNELENQTFRAQSGDNQTWHVPLVVLIDGDSASASEIFAGAIRDHQRGTLVGRRSYGKGSVQGIFSLKSADTGIRLTTAKFYSPLGKPFVKVGVEPNVQVEQRNKPLADGTVIAPEQDRDVAAALEVARENMNRRAQRGR